MKIDKTEQRLAPWAEWPGRLPRWSESWLKGTEFEELACCCMHNDDRTSIAPGLLLMAPFSSARHIHSAD